MLSAHPPPGRAGKSSTEVGVDGRGQEGAKLGGEGTEIGRAGKGREQVWWLWRVQIFSRTVSSTHLKLGFALLQRS